jgi:hypothetical protein
MISLCSLPFSPACLSPVLQADFSPAGACEIPLLYSKALFFHKMYHSWGFKFASFSVSIGLSFFLVVFKISSI